MGIFHLLVSSSISGIRGRMVHSFLSSFFHSCPSHICRLRVSWVSSPSMAKRALVRALLGLYRRGVFGDGGVSEGISRLYGPTLNIGVSPDVVHSYCVRHASCSSCCCQAASVSVDC